MSTQPGDNRIIVLVAAAMGLLIVAIAVVGVLTFAQNVELLGQAATPITRAEPTQASQPTATPPEPTAQPTPTPTPFDDTLRVLESSREMVQLVNEVRCEEGLTPVTLNPLLAEAALIHASDMALNAFFEHTGSDGSTVADRADRVGYGWIAVGENIAAGPPDAERVHTLWMDSEGHRANILNTDFREMGIGHVFRAGTQYQHYWAQVFGSTGGDAGVCE